MSIENAYGKEEKSVFSLGVEGRCKPVDMKEICMSLSY